MPIYEYEPTLTSENEPVSDCCFFEVLQSHSEQPLSHCPRCNSKIHRCLSLFGVAVKAPNSSSGKGIFQSSHQRASEKSEGSALGPEGDTSARRTARMAMRHICASGCRH